MKAVKSSTKSLCFLSLCALISIGASSCQSRVSEEEARFEEAKRGLAEKMQAKGLELYAAKNVSKGAVFEKEDLDLRELPQSKLMPNSLSEVAPVVGKKAKRDLQEGTAITLEDVDGLTQEQLDQWREKEEKRLAQEEAKHDAAERQASEKKSHAAGKQAAVKKHKASHK